MNTPALTKTRVAVSALMATATVATAGLATNLALSRHEEQEAVAAPDTSVVVVPNQPDDGESTQPTQKHRSSRASTGFAPTRQAGNSSGSSQTRTKGS